MKPSRWKNRIQKTLAVMAAVITLSGGLDITKDAENDWPNNPKSEQVSQPDGEQNGIEGMLKFLAGGILLGASHVLGKNGVATELRLNLRPPNDVTVEDFAKAIDQSRDELQHLISYLCEELDIDDKAIERIRLVSSVNKAGVWVNIFVHSNDTGKLKQLFELIAQLILHKMEEAGHEMEKEKIGFEAALNNVAREEVRQGRAQLRKELGFFKGDW